MKACYANNRISNFGFYCKNGQLMIKLQNNDKESKIWKKLY